VKTRKAKPLPPRNADEAEAQWLATAHTDDLTMEQAVHRSLAAALEGADLPTMHRMVAAAERVKRGPGDPKRGPLPGRGSSARQLTIRVTDEERAAWTQAAAGEGFATISDWIRAACDERMTSR
jgi:hypothetical protein